MVRSAEIGPSAGRGCLRWLSQWLGPSPPVHPELWHDHGEAPHVRECEERFVSRVLPLFKRKSTAVDHVLPELYLHGLAQGDFDLAFRRLLGTEAPLSGLTIARLKERQGKESGHSGKAAPWMKPSTSEWMVFT
jgi:hypothetical protein